MEDSFHKQSFYKNLTPIMKEKTIYVLRTAKIKNLSQTISFFAYSSIGLVFIFYFKKEFFNMVFFSSLDNLFTFTKFIIIISGSIFISSYITKTPKENYNKAITSLKNYFIMNICNCRSNCNCRNELIAYLKKQGIDLLK
jgi:hypothetical protein